MSARLPSLTNSGHSQLLLLLLLTVIEHISLGVVVILGGRILWVPAYEAAVELATVLGVTCCRGTAMTIHHRTHDRTIFNAPQCCGELTFSDEIHALGPLTLV